MMSSRALLCAIHCLTLGLIGQYHKSKFLNYDLRALYLELKKKEEQHREKVVSLESADRLKTAPTEEEPEHALLR